METFAFTALVIGAAIAVFLGTSALLAVILGLAIKTSEERESLLGPMMVEDVLEQELRDVYLSARLIETDPGQLELAREVRRYVIEVQALRCESGDEIALNERVRNWVDQGASTPAEALTFVRELRDDLGGSRSRQRRQHDSHTS